jgi:hypothetical protein
MIYGVNFLLPYIIQQNKNMKYILLDDNAIEIGGTNLTILSMLEDRIQEVAKLSTSSLTKSDISQNLDKIWIIGNIMGLAQTKDRSLIKDLFFLIKKNIKIEFDYNFCPYRGEIPHQKLGNSVCSCPYGITGIDRLAEIYDHATHYTKHIFFMSERQRAIFANHIKNMDFSKTSILSSCFTKKDLELFETLKNKRATNDKYAILKGFGGWHSAAKGVDEAKNFCETNKLEYDILSIKPYKDHIHALSEYKGLVFLPIIDDTCPRVIIEARLLGLEVITNINCQHVTEWWWKDESKTLDYIKSRPKHFWDTIDSL